MQRVRTHFATLTVACLGLVGNACVVGSSSGNDPAAEVWFPGGEFAPGQTALWRVSPIQYRRILSHTLGAPVTVTGFDDPIRVIALPNHQGHEVDPVFLEGLEEQVHALVDRRASYLIAQLACSSPPTRDCVAAYLDRVVPVIQRTATFDKITYLAVFDDVTRTTTARDGFLATVAAALLSPKTLYRTELGPRDSAETGTVPLTPSELAESLAMTVWNDVPDSELLAAASDGSLLEPTAYQAQVDRMLADARADVGVRELIAAWAGILGVETFNKDVLNFPQWNQALVESMVGETTRYLEHWVRDTDGQFDALFTSTTSFPDARLAEFYGMAAPASADVATPMPNERRGLFTQASVLAALSAPTNTALVFRGRWFLSRILCAPKARPDDSTLSLEDFLADAPPNSTLRTQLETLEASESCGGCHRAIHPPGFALEQYDGIGKFRRVDEQQRTINPASAFSETKATNGAFADAPAMLELLGGSPEVHACFVRHVFRYALGREEATSDYASLRRAFTDFAKGDRRVKAVLRSILTSESFRMRQRGA